MRFRCMRGYWNPVEVNSQDGAQVVFRCKECSVRTCNCLQAVGGDNTEPDTIAVLAAALGEMLDIKPGTIRKQRIECTDRYAKRGLRTLVAALFDEIKAARDVGHGFYAIANHQRKRSSHRSKHVAGILPGNGGRNMSGRKILAFYSPYPRAGKSQATLAALIDWFPLCKIYSFAGPVRDIVSSILRGLSINMRVLWDEKDMPINDRRFGALTPRDLMKAFGALGRDLYPDMWADMFAEELNRAPCHCFVVDDLRFPNEYAMLREEGAKIVRLTVPGREIFPSATEALLEGYEFDAELENTMNGLDIFRVKVWKLLWKLWA